MKKLLLTLSVLLVAIIFMGTSFVVASNHPGMLVATASKSNVNDFPSSQARIISNVGYKKYNSASVFGYLLTQNIVINANSGPTNKIVKTSLLIMTLVE